MVKKGYEVLVFGATLALASTSLSCGKQKYQDNINQLMQENAELRIQNEVMQAKLATILYKNEIDNLERISALLDLMVLNSHRLTKDDVENLEEILSVPSETYAWETESLDYNACTVEITEYDEYDYKKRWIASCIFLNEEFVMTNSHVVDGRIDPFSFKYDLVIKTKHGEFEDNEILINSPAHDFALLRTSKKNENAKTYHVRNMDASDAEKGNLVIVTYGGHINVDLMLIDSELNHWVDQVLIQPSGFILIPGINTTPEAIPGYSGSALFSRSDGTIIGQVYGLRFETKGILDGYVEECREYESAYSHSQVAQMLNMLVVDYYDQFHSSQTEEIVKPKNCDEVEKIEEKKIENEDTGPNPDIFEFLEDL